jgi:hypothetical protein
MFRPVAPFDPEDVGIGRVTQMVNEAGILVTRSGLGQEGQWVMRYADPTAGFEGEFWTYRNEEMESASFKPAKDFWTVSLGAEFWHCSTEYVDTAGMHIAGVPANLARFWCVESFSGEFRPNTRAKAA